MKQLVKKFLVCLGTFSTIYALTPELAPKLDNLTKTLQSLETQLKEFSEQPEQPSKAPAIWLTLENNRMIGPVTTEVITTAPPYTLKSGNQIKQIEVLSQFLTLGTFLRKEDDLMYDNVKVLLPIAKQKTIMQSTSFFDSYIVRLTSHSNTNKKLQKILKWNNKDMYISGGKKSSGYHALKNALYTMRALRTKTTSENLDDTLDIQLANTLFGSSEANAVILGKNEDGIWRKLIKDYREKQDVTVAEEEVLQENDINYLLNQQEVKKMLDTEFFNFSVFITSLKDLNEEMILTRTTDPSQASLYENSILQRKEIITSTFSSEKQNYIHAFVLGGISKAFSEDHWATLVVNIINGKVQYLILDSTNAPRYQTDSHTYKNAPEYIEEHIAGPSEDIANHINEIIELIEDVRK